MFGDGKVVGYAASADGDLTIEYIEEGNKVQRTRTAGHIHVLALREERTMREECTGGGPTHDGVSQHPLGRASLGVVAAGLPTASFDRHCRCKSS